MTNASTIASKWGAELRLDGNIGFTTDSASRGSPVEDLSPPGPPFPVPTPRFIAQVFNADGSPEGANSLPIPSPMASRRPRR